MARWPDKIWCANSGQQQRRNPLNEAQQSQQQRWTIEKTRAVAKLGFDPTKRGTREQRERDRRI
jgi:hypothetical protein